MDKEFCWVLWICFTVPTLPTLCCLPIILGDSTFSFWIAIVGLGVFGWLNARIFDWAKSIFKTEEDLNNSYWRKGRGATTFAWGMAIVHFVLKYFF